MKKIFTLIAMAIMAVGANAQTQWRPTDTAPDAGSTIIDDALLTVKTVFATTNGVIKDESGNVAPVNYAGNAFNNYTQIRVDAAPTADVPTGTNKDGSSPLVITAKKNVDITLYYRRQAADGAYTSNDGKDMKLVDQAAAATAIVAASFDATDIDGSYANATKVYNLEAGKVYTLFARGTTARLYGIDYKEGSGSSEGGSGSVEAGKYYISYNDEPTVTNVTTADMTNTGTATNCATWENGFVIMIMRSDKGFSSGSNITVDGKTYKTIKVSNGAQNKLTLPEGMIAKGITFYSYVNKDAATERDSYWKEIAGTAYDVETSGGIFASYKDFENPDKRTYSFNGDQLNVITFTNTGEQACYVVEIDVEAGSPTTGVKNVETIDAAAEAPAYNLAGQKVNKNFKGVVIQNGKKVVIK